MTDKPQPRKKISHIIVKAIRDREGREVFNDDLAKSVKLTREQVRNSVRQMIRDHPEYGIVETSPYYYVYDSTQGRPVSAVPCIPTYDELADATQAALGGDPAQTRTVNTAYARTMDQIFAEDRAANPGKYAPPALVPGVDPVARIFADDRAANPGKYPLAPGEYDVVPRTVGEYAHTATKDDTMAMRVRAASVRAVNGEVEFHVVARKGDVVILADEHDALWAAKKL